MQRFILRFPLISISNYMNINGKNEAHQDTEIDGCNFFNL